MTINRAKLKASSEREISVLKSIIDYADRMIYEDSNLSVLGGMVDPAGYCRSSQVHLYKRLRKNAFEKTVLIDTSYKGLLEFRLSSTEAVCINSNETGYCTPHSNVGRLMTICHPGYKGSSNLWGDYRVVEVRSFDRFGGLDFEKNVRNFLKMYQDGDNGTDSVHDLQDFLDQFDNSQVVKKIAKNKTTIAPITIKPAVILSPAQPELESESKVLGQPELIITKFTVIDETENFSSEIAIDDDDDDDWDADTASVKKEEYFGLSERFFTHQTIDQNKIIARSPVGAMFVEGIAGSGKTSAALGRTKMLTTFDASKITSKKEFYDILGEDQDYWASNFAGQFSQQSSIGFVRTGELIQYLQETCRRIDLPDLPVQEYKELQSRLKAHRAVIRSSVNGRRWTGLTQSREAHSATTMEWLHATDRAMAKKIASLLVNFPDIKELSAAFEPKFQPQVERVSSVALEIIKKEFEELANELVQVPRDGVFLLDRLAVRMVTKIDEVRKKIMGSQVLWMQVDGHTLFANDENSLASQLISMNAALFFQNGQRLVFLDSNGPTDKTLVLLTLSGEPLQWEDNVLKMLNSGNIIVRDSTGKNVKAIASGINHLFVNLLPESTERIYTSFGDSLKKLSLERGWGQIKLALTPIKNGKHKLNNDNNEIDSSADDPVSGQSKNRTPDAEFKRVIINHVFQPLSAIADLYLTTLQASAASFPNPPLAKKIKLQLEQFKLADEDIDLLLCVSNLMGRGLNKGGLGSLQEPDFYQSVFIDEVQDFTEQQIYLMIEQANPQYRAVTVVGDTAQKLHHGSSIDLRACFPAQALMHVQLTENLRQANMPGLALFSAVFRSLLSNGESPTNELAEKARLQAGELISPQFKVCKSNDIMDSQIIDALLKAKRNQTVAVLFPDAFTAEKVYKRLNERLCENMIDSELSEKINLARRHIRHFADVAKAKGLEFDVVILAGIDGYDLKNILHINRFYVGITRARENLTLLTCKKQFAPEIVKVRESYKSIINNT